MDTPQPQSNTPFVLPPPPLTPAERSAKRWKSFKACLWVCLGLLVVGLISSAVIAGHMRKEAIRLQALEKEKWILADRTLWLAHWELVKAGKKPVSLRFRDNDELSVINILDSASFSRKADYLEVPYDITGTLPVGFLFQNEKIIEPLPSGENNTWNTLQEFAEALQARKQP